MFICDWTWGLELQFLKRKCGFQVLYSCIISFSLFLKDLECHLLLGLLSLLSITGTVIWGIGLSMSND